MTSLFKEKCDKIFALNSLPLPTDEQAEKLEKLTQIMLTVNKSMNLTAITEENAIILKHYVDSLTISKSMPEGARVVDIGCGAGFPTLPLAIFRPDLDITALDGTAKRIEYVKNTAKELGLANVNAIAGRAEDYTTKPEFKADFREKFDVVTARAVANLPVLTELCLPFAKVGGLFASMKAAQGQAELESSANAISTCGGKLINADRFSLAADEKSFEERVIILISKEKQTPAKYPRHYSQISKKPL